MRTAMISLLLPLGGYREWEERSHPVAQDDVVVHDLHPDVEVDEEGNGSGERVDLGVELDSPLLGKNLGELVPWIEGESREVAFHGVLLVSENQARLGTGWSVFVQAGGQIGSRIDSDIGLPPLWVRSGSARSSPGGE
jgi:hypothetical protein